MKNIANLAAQAEADKSFSNFNSEEFLFSNKSGTSGFNGQGTMRNIPEGEETLIFTITNNGTSTATAILFDAIDAPAQPANVTVNLAGGTHTRLREQIKSMGALLIEGVSYIVTTDAQRNEQWRAVEKPIGAGAESVKPILPITWKGNKEQDTKHLIDPTFELGVTPNTRLEVPVLANETVTIRFQIKARVNLINVLRGVSAVEMSRINPLVGK
ncbi:hypothetical protein [Rhodoflexus caldus]|uniref:hypothetical protein n=1 Tax=Rhodoflexus caldus TaxID=2891236 RepID=UPI00202A0DE9|nr:hypothetical protein [Rhodoflexus caldus]